MAKPERFHEVEVKLRVADLASVQGALKRLRARKILPRTHEFNLLYDTRAQLLRRRGQLIRIRTERVAAKAAKKHTHQTERAVLTYKAPVRPPGPSRKRIPGSNAPMRYKIRQEAEITFTGADSLDHILRGLGLFAQFRYEKYRTTYVLPRIRGVKIELDETPVGNYLELEGSPSSIDRAASVLGYAPSEYIKATYGDLYLAECRRRGQKPGDMLFPNEKKSR